MAFRCNLTARYSRGTNPQQGKGRRIGENKIRPGLSLLRRFGLLLPLALALIRAGRRRIRGIRARLRRCGPRSRRVICVGALASRCLVLHRGKCTVGQASAVGGGVPGVGDGAGLEVPLLDAADDVEGELAVAAQRFRPVVRDRVRERQEARDAAHHHLAHHVVVVGVGVDVLHPPQARVGLGAVVEVAHHVDHLLRQLGHLEFVRQQVQVQEWADVLFLLGAADGA